VADPGRLRLVETVAEQHADDLRVAPAERRRELGAAELPPQLATRLSPRLEVQFRRIDQRPVHVPDRREHVLGRHLDLRNPSTPCRQWTRRTGQVWLTAESCQLFSERAVSQSGRRSLPLSWRVLEFIGRGEPRFLCIRRLPP